MKHAAHIRSFLATASIAGLLLGCTNTGTDPASENIERLSDTISSGSYSLSCEGSSVTDDALTATCRRVNGVMNETTLFNLSDCLNSLGTNGDIGNIDGNLFCVPPLPLVDGFEFPKSQETIYGWVSADDSTEIINHGWGIWEGLTQIVGNIETQPIRAFETWLKPADMIYRIQTGGTENLTDEALTDAMALGLRTPHQFFHAAKRAGAEPSPAAQAQIDTNIFETVSYNPAAAKHAIDNKLFLESTLNGYLDAGLTSIPSFPNDAITIKPVYKVITTTNTDANGIFTMAGWPGTPEPAKTFPETAWGACVYIDVNATNSSGNAIDTGCANRNATNTFALSDFIYDTLTEADADFINRNFTGGTASASNAQIGDTVILVGMHVTTRETERWTWQSYFWSANADAPFLPSSPDIAALRPDTLSAEASHYAMTIGYQMVAPGQPSRGGESVGTSVIAYNPHLEAGFSPDTFGLKRPIVGEDGPVTNQFGVQTNCMSCHVMATYRPTSSSDEAETRPYIADFYVSLDDPEFQEFLQLDFAWSVQGSLVKDVTGGQ